jgi:hypothetical protein
MVNTEEIRKNSLENDKDWIPQKSGRKIIMAPFHSELFPDCIAIASDTSLMICSVDHIQKIHIRTKALGERPHRIIHHSQTMLSLIFQNHS